ncbi:MAG: hypothetical protein ACYSU0_04275 [Planctomycetota bacterium]|jgi:hypothetical protein
MKQTRSRPRGWHVRRAGRARRISYGGVIAVVAVCEIPAICVLGERPMPSGVLHVMILVPLVVAAVLWAWSTATSSRGGER